MDKKKNPPDVLMVGTGEYTTGYVHGSSSTSDKKIGVVALCMFDMQSEQRNFKIGNCKLVGVTGLKFPGIRKHFEDKILSEYKDISVKFESFPADDVEKKDPKAYLKALETMKKGDLVTVVTPDDTHFEIAKAAIKKGCHVLITKPAVKTLDEQLELVKLAKENGVLVTVEFHKRWDPMYADARERIRQFGDFSFFNSYMSQPKFQLETFKNWAGTASDISYYLNSHHIDFHCWSMQGIARPLRVLAMKCTGVSTSEPYNLPENTEDTITLMVQWQNLKSKNFGTATYTSSWIASKSDVHTQQKFFYMGHKGEISIDQAHRGYFSTTDNGLVSVNPLYMKYTKNHNGQFSGQQGYGYMSIEAFVDSATKVRNGISKPEEFDQYLPTIKETLASTAILECGRRSLDNSGKAFIIHYENKDDQFSPTRISIE